MIKLVAFDWNGTIFADTHAIYQSDNEVFKLLKLKSAGFEAFQKYEVLIIGDTVEEIEIGQELGITTIAITQGNCSTVRLRAAKPDYLINSLKEVVGIIKLQS